MKSILITGCNRGLGLGLIKYLVKDTNSPKNIIATCRNVANAKELKEIADSNKNVHILELGNQLHSPKSARIWLSDAVKLIKIDKAVLTLQTFKFTPNFLWCDHFDVTKTETFDNFACEVENILDNNGLNVLFNNAGCSPKSTRINFVKPEQMIETFAVNTVGPLMLTKALLPQLKKASTINKTQPLGSSKSAIVNMTSILGSISMNDNGGLYPYRCSKAALNTATKSLSIDLKNDGIIVTCIHPGWVKTDMGGSNAPMDIETSVIGIVKLIRNLSEEHNGEFYQWDGKKLAW